MNRIFKILLFVFEGIAFYLIVGNRIAIPCFFKSVFGVPCPACGLTRAFLLILNFKIIESFKYNILGLLLFVFLLVLNIIFIIDIIKNKKSIEKLYNFFSKYYLIIIFLIILSEIFNIFNSI